MSRAAFSRVLIANRGEVALRIIRAARAQGLQSVGLRVSGDERALHIDAADHAVCLPAGASYRDAGAIIDAALHCGAQAIHPGYGFLAENADFAQACSDAGLVFIGPSAAAIRAMGDKAQARRTMAAAGLAVIPGYDGNDQTDARLKLEADRLGYPLMIKACAGGGGRGMRRVESAEDFASALSQARAEARASAGDDAVILEKAIDGARHIEFQMLADQYGRVVCLGERDCSVQRRHQKLIEEAPAPGLDEALRLAVSDRLVKAVAALGYVGAGTIEMLLSPEGELFFMEMNTRLQVEHPVTEMVTGEDIVQWQFRIAAGEPLPDSLKRCGSSGHAIEVRLCAEDAGRSFMPQTGTIHRWIAPAGIRVEHALHDGIEVSPDYDSMIAKLIAHGPDRETARKRLIRALGETAVLGIATNRGYLSHCLEHPEFIAGGVDTGFIGRHHDVLVQAMAQTSEPLCSVAACLLLPRSGRSATDTGPQATGLTLQGRFSVPVRLALDGNCLDYSVSRVGAEAFLIAGTSGATALSIASIGEGELRVALAGQVSTVRYVRRDRQLWISDERASLALEDLTYSVPVNWLAGAASTGIGPRSSAGPLQSLDAPGGVPAPLSARVSALHVAVGQSIAEGDLLVCLEAMKIEYRVTAPRAGRVARIDVTTDRVVQAGTCLLQIE